MLILEDGKPKVVEIGEWIDGYLDNKKYQEFIKLYGAEDANMELLDISKQGKTAYILSCDDVGKVKWCYVTNVTRHDPSEYVYTIKTKWGRKVTVVESKSLLVWNADDKRFDVKDMIDVCLGDKLPLTVQSEVKELMTSINLRDYMPVDEYLYGTEYNQKYYKKIKKNFEIKNDYVYTRCTKWNGSSLKDTFVLNRENGFFIGIYLAEGNTCKDYVGIANNDPYIRKLVGDWFEKNGITHKTQVKKFNPKRPGLSTQIRGYSSLLVQFLDKFVGKYSHGKFVPNEAFVAPDEFVRGLIDGYFSGDGTVTNYHVKVSSVSKDLIDGIGQLLSRYGIFSRMWKVQQKKNNIGSKVILPAYNLSIQSNYVYKFAKLFTFSLHQKQDQMTELVQKTTLGNMSQLYEEQEDVILDPIIAIEKTLASSSDLYKKVYDITVPETLNFQIFNGLCCHDTSETGYIQRRLVKAMEDCKVYYDHTVRNATGVIVQFLYGEDGMDGTRMETQIIPTIEMPYVDIEENHYLRREDKLNVVLTEKAFKSLKSKSSDIWDRCKEHFDKIMNDREFLITKVFRGDKISKITFPIPFERILKNAHERMKSLGVKAMPTDLTPAHILDTIAILKNDLKIQDTVQGTRFLHILLNLHLSPKHLLFKYNMSLPMFEWVVSEIRRFYIQAIAHAGEMVGIVAAQTIGENSTQLVLDSFHSSGTVAAVKATSGVPRFKELLSVSKNIKTPILTIFLKQDIGTIFNPTESEDGTITDPRVQQAKERSIKVMQSLEITRLIDILDNSEIYWDPSSDDGIQTSVPEDKGFLEVYRAFQDIDENRPRGQSPWVLRMKINKVKLYRLGLTMLDVYVKIHSAYQQVIECLFSDDNADELIFRVRMTELGMKDVDPEDAVAALKALEHNLIHNVLLKGMKGIKKVSMHMKASSVYGKDADGNDVYKFIMDADDKTKCKNNKCEEYVAEHLRFQKKAEWVLDTDGSNLIDILANPNVDPYRTFCNDVWEIYHTLGIEAARNAIYNEVMDIIGEDSMNYRHMSLLLDTMTNRGQLMSVDRHGINRGDVGPLAKSSFEETTDMLINASIFSEFDRINGVSANIMLGQLPPCGTGDSEILLDEEEYLKAIQDVVFSKADGEADAKVEESVREAIDANCSYEAVGLKYKLPAKRTRVMPTLTA